jgi:hypothetical protein
MLITRPTVTSCATSTVMTLRLLTSASRSVTGPCEYWSPKLPGEYSCVPKLKVFGSSM